jgi:hypothetical protein
LTRDGTETKAKAVCKPLGLSVRGLGGEHTPIGADGTVDISPSARLMIEESAIICNLYQGIKLLLEAEKKAASMKTNTKQIESIGGSGYTMPMLLLASGIAWFFLMKKN